MSTERPAAWDGPWCSHGDNGDGYDVMSSAGDGDGLCWFIGQAHVDGVTAIPMDPGAGGDGPAGAPTLAEPWAQHVD